MCFAKRDEFVDLILRIRFKPDNFYTVCKVFSKGNKRSTGISDAKDNEFAVCCSLIRQCLH